MAKDKNVSMQENELEETGSDPRVYELGFHLDPELPAEGVKKAYQVIRDTIAKKGTLVAEGEPEKIQLAYTISRQEVSGRRDFDSAYFAWIAYETTPDAHAEVLAMAHANTQIVRCIDLVTTKDSARYSVELRELSKKMPEPVESSEAVAGAELDAVLENVVI